MDSYYFLGILGITFMFIASFMEIVKAYVFKIITDFASGMQYYHFKEIIILCILFVVIYFIMHICRGSLTFLLKSKIRSNLRDDLLTAINKTSIVNYYKSLGSSKVINIFNNEVETVINSYFTSIFNIIYMGASLILGFIAIIKLNILYIVSLSIGSCIIFFSLYIFKKILSERQHFALQQLEKLIHKIRNYSENFLLIKTNHLQSWVNENPNPPAMLGRIE